MKTTTTLPYPRRRANEIAVNARLLYLYVGHPRLKYEEWATSLHLMVSSRGYPSQFRLMIGDDGELALSDAFATHFAQRVATDIMGVFALVLIDEGCSAIANGDTDYTNKMLKHYRILALARGRACAKHLHEFLQVEKPFSDWVTQLKRDYAMKYKADYVMMYIGKDSRLQQSPKDDGKGAMVLDASFAMKVACAEPTRRGKLVRKCSEEFNLA